MALVVNELVTNALAHGFAGQDTGKSEIIFKQENGYFTVKVLDSGQGLPEDFSLSGEASPGLKLATRIVQKLLRGTLNYHSNEWTMFEFKFPVKA